MQLLFGKLYIRIYICISNNDKKLNNMKNSFNVGAKYNAAQNISRLSLSNGNTPLFYQGLIYLNFDPNTSEHLFEYEGEIKWFDDAFINNGKVEDNSMIFAEIKS